MSPKLENDEGFAAWAEGPDAMDHQEDERTSRVLLSVALYQEDQQYGGPEEGGWWYDAGELLHRPARYFRNEDAAYAYARRFNDLLHHYVNRHRPSYSSVLSEGRVVAMVHEGHPPAYYPATRPHYE